MATSVLSKPSSFTNDVNRLANILRFGGILVLLGLWEIAASITSKETEVVPHLSSLGAALVRLFLSPSLAADFTVTASEVAISLVTAFALTAVLVAIVSSSKTAMAAVPLLLYWGAPTPKIIFFPVALTLLGVGIGSKVAIGALSAFPTIAISMIAAISQIDRIYLDVAQSFRMSRAQTVMKIYVPSIAQHALTGLRLALGLAIIGVLLAETKLAANGLGFRAIQYYNSLRIADMYAVLIVVFAFSALLNAGISALEGKTSQARPRAR
jgi:ABC-type nitrate/sulfonate/bicarbonate transport system permease component